MENGYGENEAATRNPNSLSLFPACATITLEANGDGTGTILLDFGNGECDAQAVFTFNGVDYTVFL